MQHYLWLGFGFAGSLLTEDQADYVMENNEEFKSGDVYLQFVPFTEDYKGPNWGAVILKPIERLGVAGKMATAKELSALFEEYNVITDETRNHIATVLGQANLAHLIDRVELVLYSDNY